MLTCWLDANQYIPKVEFRGYGLISINYTINFRRLKSGSSSPFFSSSTYARNYSISIQLTKDTYQILSEIFKK